MPDKTSEGRRTTSYSSLNAIDIRKDTMCSKDIGPGGRLNICQNEHIDKDDPLLTIQCYTKRKIMIQGNEANLEFLEEPFPPVKH